MADLIYKEALIEELHHMVYDDAETMHDYEYLGIDDCIRSMPTTTEAEIRSKAIDEFAEAVNKRIKEEVALLEQDREEAKMCDDEQIIFATNNQLRAFEYSLRVIAEQLKGE